MSFFEWTNLLILTHFLQMTFSVFSDWVVIISASYCRSNFSFTTTLKRWRVMTSMNTAQVLTDFTEMLHHFFAVFDISLSPSSITGWLLYSKKKTICSNRNRWIMAQSGVFVTGCHGPCVSRKEVNGIFVISWVVCSSELVPYVWVSKFINVARWKSESLK